MLFTLKYFSQYCTRLWEGVGVVRKWVNIAKLEVPYSVVAKQMEATSLIRLETISVMKYDGNFSFGIYFKMSLNEYIAWNVGMI